MTISAHPVFVTYTGDGTTASFSFDKRIYDADELLVYTYTPGTDTVPVRLTAGYTATVAGDYSGATVTLATAPASGVKIGLLRATALTQDIDVSDTEYVPPSEVEKALDRNAMMAQEVALFGALGLNTDPFDFTQAARAGHLLIYDEDGRPTIGPTADNIAGAQASANAAAASAAAAASSEIAAAGSASEAATSATAIATAPQWAFVNKTDIHTLFDPATAPTFVNVGGFLYKYSASEPSHAGKVQDKAGNWYALAERYPTPEMFDAVGDGATDDTTALAALLEFAPAGTEIDLHRTTYKFSTLSVSKDVTLRNGTLKSAVATGVLVSVDPAARLTARGVKFIGGGSETVVDSNQSHSIISQVGASSASRGVGVDLEDCQVSGCGFMAILLKFSDNNRIVKSKLSNFAYGGLMAISCNNGVARENRVEGREAAGIGNDCYGMAFTHNSLNYNTDPNAGTPQAANPFSAGWLVIGNTVIAPKRWEGIDTHGGYNHVFAHNKVYGGKIGMQIGGSSGNATGYAGYNTVISHNLITSLNEDGTLSDDTIPAYGLVFQGGGAPPVIPFWRVVVTGNTINGYGGTTFNGAYQNNAPAVYINTGVVCFVFTDNIVTNWSGTAVGISQGSRDGVINNNVFSGELTNNGDSAVIRFESDASGRFSIIGNIMSLDQYGPTYGVVVSSSVKAIITYGSDFTRATHEIDGSFTSPGQYRSVQYA